MKKRILIAAKSLGGGGTETALVQFINALDSNRYDITLLLMDEDTEYENRLKNNVDIVYMNYRYRWQRHLISMYTPVGKFFKKIAINKWIPLYEWMFDKIEVPISGKFDIALDFYGYGAFTTAWVACCVDARKKATWVHDEFCPWLVNTKKFLNVYDEIECVSQAVANNVCELFPEFARKVHVTYNIMDVKAIRMGGHSSPDDARFVAKGKGVYVITTIARLHPQKGIDIAAKAARILKGRNFQFRWYVIGEGREWSKIKKYIYKNKIDDVFILLGRKANPYPYVSSSDLYVQPSRHEGLGISIFEARILNIPVLASDIPSSREQIIDGNNGRLVTLDAEKIADTIFEISCSKKRYEANLTPAEEDGFKTNLYELIERLSV